MKKVFSFVMMMLFFLIGKSSAQDTSFLNKRKQTPVLKDSFRMQPRKDTLKHKRGNWEQPNIQKGQKRNNTDTTGRKERRDKNSYMLKPENR